MSIIDNLELLEKVDQKSKRNGIYENQISPTMTLPKSAKIQRKSDWILMTLAVT